jgi:hypothetical protein
MNVTPIAVVTIDPELIENLIDMEKIDVESDDDCTDRRERAGISGILTRT